MSKASARNVVCWSTEQNLYLLFEGGKAELPIKYNSDPFWQEWLSTHTAFSFHGKNSQLTLQKETRRRGNKEGYWYAYQRQHKRTVKRYAGRSAGLTLAHLEELALSFSNSGNPDLPQRVASKERFSSGVEADTLTPKIKLTPRMSKPANVIEPVPLLALKLHPPRLPSTLVSREHLLKRLNGGLDGKLTLVVAPAGFGKTTLVNQWVSEHLPYQYSTPFSIAWVSLDEGDNDPTRFWRYLLTACQNSNPQLGFSSLALLQTEEPSFEPFPLKAILSNFLNEATRLDKRGIIVLEDYHLISNPLIHQAVVFLIDNLPPTLHLVILSRAEPSLPLTRWRAKGDLLELKEPELQFTFEETASFLRHNLSYTLTPQTLTQLEAHLEGWVTGLHLLVLTLQGHVAEHEIEQYLASYSGSQRHLVEYFVTEVLEAQSKSLQLFLLQTSPLSRLTGSLCDTITGRNDSERLLKALERRGLFLQPLKGAEEWYRYHSLFAEAMQYAARQRLGKGVLQASLSQASFWYEEHEMLAEAVETALQAAEYKRAASLIERIAGLRHSTEYQELFTLKRWLEQLPSAVLYSYPTLCYTCATTLVFTSVSNQLTRSVIDQVEVLLHQAEQGWHTRHKPEQVGEVLAFRALLAMRQENTRAAFSLAHQAQELLPVAKQFELSRIIILGILGEEARQYGRFEQAWQILLEARSLCEANRNRPGLRILTIGLGEVCISKGELRQAAEFFQWVLAEAEADEDFTDNAKALLNLGQLSYQWNKLDTALEQARAALELGNESGDELIEARATLLLAQIKHAQGETLEAQQILQALLAKVVLSRSEGLYREIQVWQARFALSTNQTGVGERWVTTHSQSNHNLPLWQTEQTELITARFLIAQGEAAGTLTHLEELKEAALHSNRPGSLIEIGLVLALAYNTCQQKEKARQLLLATLSLALAEGFCRVFLDEGEELASLLRSVLPGLKHKGLLTFAQTLLNQFEQGKTRSTLPATLALYEPLSSQEQRVLRLLLAGCSNLEIAQNLYISINTVKTHLRRLYDKLEVSNRAAACEKARQLQLDRTYAVDR